jgi:hypothetical protein
MGEWMYRSTFFLTSALVGGEWSASRPCRFTFPFSYLNLVCIYTFTADRLFNIRWKNLKRLVFMFDVFCFKVTLYLGRRRRIILQNLDKSGAGAGFLRELRFPLPIYTYIPSASPQSSSLSPEAGTLGQEWPQCQ